MPSASVPVKVIVLAVSSFVVTDWAFATGAAGAAAAAPPDVTALDAALRRLNPSYHEMRLNDWIYGPSRCVAIPEHVFAEYRARNLDRGQFKARRLFKSREGFEREYGAKLG